MFGNLIPDIFEIPGVQDRAQDGAQVGKRARWMTGLAMTAIIIGATVALVAMNYAPGADPQVTVGR
jgi:hypothetical protein